MQKNNEQQPKLTQTAFAIWLIRLLPFKDLQNRLQLAYLHPNRELRSCDFQLYSQANISNLLSTHAAVLALCILSYLFTSCRRHARLVTSLFTLEQYTRGVVTVSTMSHEGAEIYCCATLYGFYFLSMLRVWSQLWCHSMCFACMKKKLCHK